VSHINQQIELNILAAAAQEENLFTLIRAGSRLSKTAADAYRQRGVYAFEVMRRVQKLPGGRGKKDLKKRGRMQHLDKIAKHWNMGRSTLITDAKIYLLFFRPEVIKTTLAYESSLGPRFRHGIRRGFFAVAAYTTDPFAALKIAIDKLHKNPDYTVRSFKDDVSHLRPRARQDEKEKAEKENFLRIPLTMELDEALQELSEHEPFKDKTIEEIAVAVIMGARLESAVTDVAQAVRAASQEVPQQDKVRDGRRRSVGAEANPDQRSLLSLD